MQALPHALLLVQAAAFGHGKAEVKPGSVFLPSLTSSACVDVSCSEAAGAAQAGGEEAAQGAQGAGPGLEQRGQRSLLHWPSLLP